MPPDRRPFSADEMRMGIAHELEHTDDEAVAAAIAADHLAEMPDYYTRLEAMEERARRGLAPNSPKKRLAYIHKLYGETEPWAVLETFLALADTLGIEHPEDRYSSAFSFWRGGHWALERGSAEWQEAKRRADALVRLVELDPSARLGERQPSDPLWPWVAKELVQAKRRAERKHDREAQGLAEEELAQLLDQLGGKGVALTLWRSRNRIDLGRYTLEQALEELGSFEVELEDGVQQGVTVYDFGDGWTVQRLRPEDLEDEGETMQHCVADYADAVGEGRSVIYSLRDPHGQPHVTIEYNPILQRVHQVMGKQNTRPKPAYAHRAERFLKTLPLRALERVSVKEAEAAHAFGRIIADAHWEPDDDVRPGEPYGEESVIERQRLLEELDADGDLDHWEAMTPAAATHLTVEDFFDDYPDLRRRHPEMPPFPFEVPATIGGEEIAEDIDHLDLFRPLRREMLEGFLQRWREIDQEQLALLHTAILETEERIDELVDLEESAWDVGRVVLARHLRFFGDEDLEHLVETVLGLSD